MSALTDLIEQVNDQGLRERLLAEASRLSKQKKFGLVFEDHLPECTPLYDIPVKKGSTVARKQGNINEVFIVIKIDQNIAVCLPKNGDTTIEIPLVELVTVAEFGSAIYPCLKKIDSVCRAPESDLWHTLIEADNYHALQLLEYLYAGKVDCIYIDPPYNSGAKDWKYNNDYVDGSDSYRHSKWLSMMQKRLKIAKRLLNPADSVLIVTIDEKEYLHLGCLLEEMFPEANIQMISSVINPAGVSRVGQFARTDEYIFFLTLGVSAPVPVKLEEDWRGNIKGGYKDKLRWNGLQRSGTATARADRPNMFYPIFLNKEGTKIESVGESIPLEVNIDTIYTPHDQIAVWPLFPDGREGRWRIGRQKLLELIDKHYVHIGKVQKNRASITYLAQGEQIKVENGDFPIIGYNPDGSIIVDESSYEARFIPGTQWWINSHDATQKGTKILNDIIGRRFTFPKSIYAVHDAIRFFVANKPNALIVDFFAGSGTTLHAVNLLNAEDGGKRRCIMVTNNEVSADEATTLKQQGYNPGDAEWEKLGIARYVNWPRTKCSIQGVDVNGAPISGEYLTTCKQTVEIDRKIVQVAMDGNSMSTDAKKSIIGLLAKSKIPQNALTPNCNYILGADYTTSILFNVAYADEWLEALEEHSQVAEIYIVTDRKPVFNQLKNSIKEMLRPITQEESVKFSMADGFKANAVFFKLSFLDKNAVALGRQFRELLSTLWMKAGAYGVCPVLTDEITPDILIFPQNRFAVLLKESAFAELETDLANQPEIETVYIITDSEARYCTMAKNLKVKNTYQLYRDYLDNFRINTERN